MVDAAAGSLAPIDDYVKNWDEWSQYPESSIQGAKGLDGKIYGVPFGTDTRGIYYNKKIFEQAGLPTDWQPKSWDDLLSAARTIKEKVPDVIPMNIYAGRAGGEQTSMQGFEMLLYGTQDTLYNTDTNKWVTGSQGFKDALTFYQTAYSEGLTPSNDIALDKAVGTRVSTELLPKGKLAIDIDGTLINSKREITPRVKAALNAASAQGVYVVLCTGRPYPGVEGLLQELDLVNDHDYVVTYNGTLVQQTGSKKALVRFSMTHDDLERVNDYATKYNVHYHAIDEEAIYVPTETVGKYSIHESELVGMPIIHQLYKDIPTDKEFVKIMFVDEPEVLEELIPNLSDDFKSRYNIFRSAGFYLEVIHPEASKGKAVHHLADKLGLTRDEVMCLGDHENDRDMIEYAGLGIAMGNAIDSIKEIANFVTTTNDEDGVAVAVEKFVLNKEN